MCKLGDVLSKLVQLKRMTDEGLGAELPATGGYGSLLLGDFLKNAIGSQFARILSHLKALDF